MALVVLQVLLLLHPKVACCCWACRQQEVLLQVLLNMQNLLFCLLLWGLLVAQGLQP